MSPTPDRRAGRLQNRVDPWGTLAAVQARGTLMGNRGCLHNDQKQVIRAWKNRAWITCTLEVQSWGKRQEMMAPGSYTELFFLDEATAYAAGHRPCALCRRKDFDNFLAAWTRCYGIGLRPNAKAVDAVIHDARVNSDGAKQTWRAQAGDLPDGSMFELNGTVFLVWSGRFLRWSFNGYSFPSNQVPAEEWVSVLTPEPIVRLFKVGLVPDVHPSAS